MAEPTVELESREKIIRPLRFRVGWALGFGLAAAAAVVLLVRVNFQPLARPNLGTAHELVSSQLLIHKRPFGLGRGAIADINAAN